MRERAVKIDMGHNSNFLPQCIAAMKTLWKASGFRINYSLQMSLASSPEVGFGVCLWVMPCCNAWAVERRILPSAPQGH